MPIRAYEYARSWPSPIALPTSLREDNATLGNRGDKKYRADAFEAAEIIPAFGDSPALLNVRLRWPLFGGAKTPRDPRDPRDHALGVLVYVEDDGCRRWDSITWRPADPASFAKTHVEWTVGTILTAIVEDATYPTEMREAVRPFEAVRTPQLMKRERRLLRTALAAVKVGIVTHRAIADEMHIALETAKTYLFDAREASVLSSTPTGTIDRYPQLLLHGQRLLRRYPEVAAERA